MMTDPVDVDSSAMPDSTRLVDDGDCMSRSQEATSENPEDVIDLPELMNECSMTVTHEPLPSQPPQQTPADKDNMSLVSTRDEVPSLPLQHSQNEQGQQIFKFIEKVAGPLTSHQGSDIPNEQDFQEYLDRNLSAIEALKKGSSATRKKLQLAERENEKIKRQNEAVIQAHLNLKAYARTMEKEKYEHENKILRLENEITALTRTGDQLRHMLVPVSEKQVLDSDVVSRFAGLGNSIVVLVRQTWKMAPKADVDFGQLDDDQRDFFGPSVPMSYDRLRYLVFRGIYSFILGPQGYFLGKGLEKLEDSLQSAERELNRNSTGEDRRQIMEWRNAGFKATEKFRDNKHPSSSAAQKRIWNFLLPLQLRDAAAEQSGKNRLEAICDNSVELGIMIRQLQDDFRVDDLSGAVGKPISEWGVLAEDFVSVPAPTAAHSGNIAYVIMGSLYKSPKEDLQNILVLQKGQVAVYR